MAATFEPYGPLYRDRPEAGRRLGAGLAARVRDPVVLALPRGGVPVAYEVAEALHAPLDVVVVRKLGAPGQGELAMGAIASGGARVLNEDVLRALGLREEDVAAVEAQEREELRRRERDCRGDRPFPPLAGRTAVLVDDGLATGATMRAAVAAVRQRGPAAVVVAVPVASREAIELLRGEADEVVSLAAPPSFFAVGQWYEEFGQTSDAEVRALLARAWRAPARAT
ncbi:MAG: phosphoribosyltransferase [Planctomycetes bacterium]|nr:phosphoribosyltransferase [Planctomycetota bacterium]